MTLRATWLALAFTGITAAFFAGDIYEKRLDPALKMIYRSQQSQGALSGAPGLREDFAPCPGLTPDQAMEFADRVIGRRPLTKRGTASPRLPLLVKYIGDIAELGKVGFEVQAKAGPIVAGYLPADRVTDLAKLPGLHYAQFSQTLWASGPAESCLSSTDAILPGGLAAPTRTEDLSGSNVLVAFIDTGVDIFHQDFRKTDGTTRIKFLLDFSLPGDTDGDGDLDGTGPFGGTLYTEAEINAALASGTFASKDTTGHGTHGLSVAAGDDSALPGIAPASNLIVVKATREDGTLGFWSIDIVNALSFVDQKAGELGQPYVANLSLGSIFSSHDGRSLEEQAVDAIIGPSIAGKTVVIAAGNSSENRSTRYHHFSDTAYVGIPKTHTLMIPAYTPNPGNGNDRVLFDLWFEGNDQTSITVTSPNGHGATATYGDYADQPTADGDIFIANMGGANPANGDVEVVILIDDWSGNPPAQGSWTISITGTQIGDTGLYHGWMADESAVGTQQPYLSANADNSYLVAKPGGAYHGITVGSYARHDPATRFRTSWTDVNAIERTDTSAIDQDISDFSSTGKTRDGRIKPDLTAPGERVLGAVSGDAYPGVSPASIYQYHPFAEIDALITDDTVNHAFGALQGTSFSAPVVAGLAARILSTNSSLDTIEVRNVLLNSAITDAFTGDVPNDRWGYGKASLTVGSAPLPESIRITTDSLPDGVLGQFYQVVLTAAGGILPYSWSTLDPFPTGLTLSGNVLSGTPTASGAFTFTMRVADSSAPAQANERDFSHTVHATQPLTINTVHLPAAHLGKAYDCRLEASGGLPPYGWFLSSGPLAPGLSLVGNRITGVATVLGSYSITLSVQDAAPATARQSYVLHVRPSSGDRWSPLGGYTTSANQIAVDPNDPFHLACSTENTFEATQEAVFETSDKGDSWAPISVNNGFGQDTAVALGINPVSSVPWAIQDSYHWVFRYDPSNDSWVNTVPCPGTTQLDAMDFDSAGSVFVAGGGCSSAGAFLRSDDNGLNWTKVGDLCTGGLYGFDEDTLSIYRANPAFLYATRAGMDVSVTCSSVDGGATWSAIGVLSSLGDKYYDVQVSQSDPADVLRALYLGFYHFVERSTDGGQNWERRQVTTNTISPCCMKRAPSDPSVVYFATSGTIHKSTDNGQTWTQLASSFPSPQALAVDPNDKDTVYFATSGGVYLSTDGGNTWSCKSDGLLMRSLSGIAMSRAFPGELMTSAANQTTYLTRSSGERWTSSKQGIGNINDLYNPVISGSDPDLYLVAGTFSLYRSRNRGISWTELTSAPFSDLTAFDADPFVSGGIALANRAAIYRSLDGGETWNQEDDNVGDINDLTFARDVPGRIFAASTHNAVTGGLFRSVDGGASWQPFGLNNTSLGIIEPAPSNSDYVYAVSRFGYDVYYRDPSFGSWNEATLGPPQPVLCLAIEWNNPLVAYAGADHPGTAGGVGGLYKTTDGGRTWTRLAGVLDQHDVTGVVTHPTEPGTVYVSTREGGVYLSTDAGLTWTGLDTYGTIADMVNENRQDPSNANLLFAATEGYGVQASTNKGQSYVPRITGLGNLYVNAVAFDPTTPSTIYAATDAGIYKSTNSGNNWATTALTTGEVLDVVTDNQGTAKRIWAVVKGQGVAFSNDGGTTFNVYSTGLASLELTGLEIETIGTAKRIWAVMHGGDGVAYSDDLGQTWHGAAGNGLTDRDVNDLTIESGTAKRIWAVTSNGVFYTRNDGLSWAELSLGLPSNTPVTSVVVDPNTKEALVSLFAEDGGGVYRGGNVNGVWSAFNEGLDYLKVRRLTRDAGHDVDLNTRGTTYYAATAGDGVYASELKSPKTATPPTVNTSSLADGYVASAYSAALAATGGTPPYTWSVSAGSLPTGLTLAGTGNLSGAPGIEGYCSFTVRVADANLKLAEKALSIRVWERVSVSPTTLPSVQREQAYPPAQLAASGGKSPLVWTISGGALPSGLGLSSGGLLSGTPTASGTFSFTARATDANGSYGERAFAVTITPHDEVSAPGASVPFTLQRNFDGTMRFRWEDFGTSATAYNLYEGPLGSFGSAAQLHCGLDGAPDGLGRLVYDHSVGSENSFYLITASDASKEMSPGLDSSGNPRTLPSPCGPH